MNVDDLEIIKTVQANPCLYTKNISSYKNVDKKDCWNQIGAMLSIPKTGEVVQKRWDSLRTMFVRAHRKRMEYILSDSGATDGPHESEGIDFIYYAEMSFLIPHYKPRMTSISVQTLKPTSESVSKSAVPKSASTILPTNSTWDFDLTESTNIADTDDSCFSSSSIPIISPSTTPPPIPSPTSASESIQLNLNSVQNFVPFSPSAIKAMESKSNIRSQAPKFKRKVDTEVVVPPSDNFSKRKRNVLDTFLGETSNMMNQVLSKVDNVISNRQTKELLPEDSALASLSVTIANTM